MDVQAYIDSGIIQDYCLGLLTAEEMQQVEQHAAGYPAIRTEINIFRQVLEQYALPHAQPTPDGLKDKVLGLIGNLAREKSDGVELPLINKYSSWEFWLPIVKPLLPEKPTYGFFAKVLRSDNDAFQSIIWTSNDIPEEMHSDMRESFIILEGECECYLGDEIVRLGPGGFVEIPLHVPHSVKALGDQPVLAILQRLKVA